MVKKSEKHEKDKVSTPSPEERTINKDPREDKDFEFKTFDNRFKVRKSKKDKNKDKLFELEIGGIKEDLDCSHIEIEEDRLSGELIYNEFRLRFCPRGYYINEVWVPLAIMVFSILESNPELEVKTYDEVN